MFQDKDDVDKALTALGEQLAAIKSAPMDLLVCGGSALQALGLVQRTTQGVDVLALVSGDSEALSTAEPLPDPIVEASQKVGRDLNLAHGWINPGPTSALDLGLPEGTLARAVIRRYGDSLTIRFLSRYDQIHFKLYAAVDQGGRHYDDLVVLKPTSEELEAAARWSMTHDVSVGYKGELKNLLKKMEHGDVAQKI